MDTVNPILGAAALLALWSTLMTFILVARRVGAGMKLSELPPGMRGVDGEASMPQGANWTAHNYTHLMEQPTVFYAAVIILAMAGDTSTYSLYAAWTYAIFRIVLSFWQMYVSAITVRFILVLIGTLALTVLSVHASPCHVSHTIPGCQIPARNAYICVTDVVGAASSEGI